MENNYLSKAQQEQFKEKMAACQDQACRDEVRGEVEELSARQDAALRAACTDPNSGACVQHLVLAQEYAKSDGRDQAMELGLQLDWVRSFREISQFLNGTEGLNVRTTFSDDIVNPWSRHLDLQTLAPVAAVVEPDVERVGGLGRVLGENLYSAVTTLAEFTPFGDLKAFVGADSASGYMWAAAGVQPIGDLSKAGNKAADAAVQLVRHGDEAADLAKTVGRLDADGGIQNVFQVSAGSKNRWDRAINGSLEPNSAYVLDNRHVYVTDSAGRVKRVEGELSLSGAGDRINIVPQASMLNRGDWKAMENELRRALDNGQSVGVKIDVGYPSGGEVRPNRFQVTPIIDGKPNPRLSSINSL